MDGIGNFLQMGGYGAFVWPAYGLAALVMIALALASLRRLRHGRKTLERLEAAAPPRRAKRHAAGGEELAS